MKTWQVVLRWVRRLRSEGVLDLLIVLWLILFVGAISVYLLDYTHPERSFGNPFDAFYWAWVTMTTVGYGDMTPHSVPARIAASVMMFASMALISFFTATISSIFVARKIREGKGLAKVIDRNHYVICGWNDLADELLESLLDQLAGTDTPIVLVNELSEEEVDSWRSQFKAGNLGFVRGDFTQDEVLEKANISRAKAVLILPNLIKVSPAEADEKTALAVYSIKALAPKVKVYAYLIHHENKTNLRRANADGIIVADEFGPFIGAAQLHNPGIPAFLEEMLNSDRGHLQTAPVPENMRGKTFGELFQWMYGEKGKTVLGVYTEEQTAGLSDFLSDDSGDYLDQFIAAKLKAAGRTAKEEQKIKVRISPEKDTQLGENEHMILLD
jgi:voltage-gated potassium channel